MPYTGSRKDTERRRLHAMTLLDQGWMQSDVARELGVTPAAVSIWVKHRKTGGEAALKAKPHSGPKPKLNDQQIDRLKRWLLQGGRKRGRGSF